MIAAGRLGRSYVLTLGIGVALVIAMGAILLAGFRLATGLHTDVAALQSASALQSYPGDIARELDTLRERLEVRAYSGRALADLRDSVRRFDEGLARLDRTDAADSVRLGRIREQWRGYHAALDPVLAFDGQPYVDSDSAGSMLSREGRAHFADVKHAGVYAAVHARAYRSEIAAVVNRLQSDASAAAVRLRMLLLGGVLAALVLAAAALRLQIARARHARAAREAQEQTRDILKTVREGFFLLDAGHRIGSVWSDALTRMFNRHDFAGLSFHDLLKDLVPPGTLATAGKYINLLWGDRAHENLMKSINPLAQLEITVENERGGRDTRFLQFDFHRVTGPAGVKHVLCAVTDITSSVLLSRELQESHENANAQLDMLIGMTRTDPLQLTAFLDAADAGLKHVNAILKEPARTDAEFRRKLGGLLRELHAMKGEAAALELRSIADRLHALEDMVSGCEAKRELSGADFLPIVLKLDELLAHLRGVREIASRLTLTKEPEARPAGQPLGTMLESMAAQLAHDHGKRLRFESSGLADVPPTYVKTVRECAVQLMRNAAVHGIEPPERRRAQAKDEQGVVRAEFRQVRDGYELVFEDDGAGVAPQSLKEAALRRNLITPDEAAAMDARAAMALMFRPGLTTAGSVSMDAGRGVGMDVVARSIHALGGKIGVSTNPGRFTRFKITLPRPGAADGAAAHG